MTAFSNGELLCRLLRLDDLSDEEINAVVAISMYREANDSAGLTDDLAQATVIRRSATDPAGAADDLRAGGQSTAGES
jgi:hypothetical protein